MKRLLIGLLVLSLLLWTASTAFAGFKDTAGTKYEDAVETLTTLDLLRGFPDGTFRPGETITRA
ncbi:MAG: S-layer homology domain-containing protein, partial [Firmicutes bacterium]|nr:S-layer homology domain-containing protein [Bacillota bacterium]